MSELKITQEKVTAAFSEANDCPKAISILTALFGKQKPDYTDYHNIKTYEDACEAIGVKPIVRLLVEDEDGHKEEVADIAHLAYIKLCTIARALNNDPNFPRFGSRLAVKSSEIAIYFGEQFKELWKDFLIGKK